MRICGPHLIADRPIHNHDNPGQAVKDTRICLSPGTLPLSDACRPALGSDAFSIWRALSERSELVRPPLSGVRPIL